MTKSRGSRKKDRSKGDLTGGDSNRSESQPERGDVLEIQAKDSGTAPVNQIVICKYPGCHDISTTHNFCRFHYLSSWKKLKTKEAKKKGQELEAYLEELSRKFPEEFLEKLKAEVEDMAERESTSESSDDEKTSLYDSMEGDEDLDTIIQGLKVEDF